MNKILNNENGHSKFPSWLGVILLPFLAVSKAKDGVGKIYKKIKGISNKELE